MYPLKVFFSRKSCAFILKKSNFVFNMEYMKNPEFYQDISGKNIENNSEKESLLTK